MLVHARLTTAQHPHTRQVVCDAMDNEWSGGGWAEYTSQQKLKYRCLFGVFSPFLIAYHLLLLALFALLPPTARAYTRRGWLPC